MKRHLIFTFFFVKSLSYGLSFNLYIYNHKKSCSPFSVLWSDLILHSPVTLTRTTVHGNSGNHLWLPHFLSLFLRFLLYSLSIYSNLNLDLLIPYPFWDPSYLLDTSLSFLEQFPHFTPIT